MFTRALRSRPPSAAFTATPTLSAPPSLQRLPAASDRQPVPFPSPVRRAGVFWWPGEGMGGPTDPFCGSGKHVAAAAWVKAMARHGSLPQMDLFVPLIGMEGSRAPWGEVDAEALGARRLRYLAESDLPTQCREASYDVLHAPMGIDLTRPSYARSRYSRSLFPITCSQHGISYGLDLQFTLVRLLTTPIYPCDAIVCLTDSSRRAMANRLGDLAERYSAAWNQSPPPLPRLEQIPWGIDTDRFAPRDSASARRDFDLPLDRPIVLCLGRVRIQDKMDWTPLLFACQQVLKTVQPAPLFVFAGSGIPQECEQMLSHAAQLGLGPHVRTFFNVAPSALPGLYAACDVFVSPTDSPSESFGLTIIEAMASGRPVVASDWDGYQELIVEGETGFKIRTDWADCLGEVDEVAPLLYWEQEHLHVGQSVSVDVAQLAQRLSQLLQNPALRETMGRNGRQRAQSLYSWPTVIAQWEAMWSELMAIARSLESPEPERRLDYLRPRYFRQFGHYASRIVDDETPLRLTVRGKETLAERAPFFLHPWTRGFLGEPYLQAALVALKGAGWLGVGLPVGKVLETLQKVHGLGRDRALMHVMWLAKYDLVALGTPAEEGGDG